LKSYLQCQNQLGDLVTPLSDMKAHY